MPPIQRRRDVRSSTWKPTRRSTWRWSVAATTLLLLAAAPVTGQETEANPPPRLAAVTATWSGVPLRTVCRRLGDVARRPVVLDRRLDPEAPITLDVRDAALVAVFERIATPLGASVAVLSTSIRIVPGRAAASLVAADAERARAIAALPAASRRVAQRLAPWSWEDGARPHDLLVGLADGARLDVAGLDAIPHDHLAAADLPALPLAERLDLLLAQYDRRIDWGTAEDRSGRMALEIAPLPADVPSNDATVVFGAPAAGGGAGVSPPPHRGPPGRSSAGKPTWTLEVAAPLDQLLATVAKRMDLDLDLDREGLRSKGIAPAEIVRLSVKEVDRDVLLDRIVGPLDLAWTIDGRTLRVGPKAE